MSQPIKIIIADDHTIFREGLEFVLSQISDFKVVGTAANGLEILELIDKIEADIILLDISMPMMDGIEATQRILAKKPLQKIITLSSYGQEAYYYTMIKAGVMGFLEKKAGKDELEEAIRAVMNGQNYFPQDILRQLIFKTGNENKESLEIEGIHLSPREKEVLLLICQGYSNTEIGDKLFLSPKTVDNHRTNLLSKTNTRNSANLVMFAIKNRLIEV
jgi:DNA-binding NarL/FixJ family response regulator